MGTWDRQKEWKEIDESGRYRKKSNKVLPELSNLKVAPKNSQGFFARIKLYIKNLLKL
ncbi:MAG: hypothetical protein SCH70_07345 [Candidatus Methanoperedens sp.]|nr:hypothetical protein [Candidatus Methanoperedens sp.]